MSVWESLEEHRQWGDTSIRSAARIDGCISLMDEQRTLLDASHEPCSSPSVCTMSPSQRYAYKTNKLGDGKWFPENLHACLAHALSLRTLHIYRVFLYFSREVSYVLLYNVQQMACWSNICFVNRMRNCLPLYLICISTQFKPNTEA